ncbi:hypothetical protein AE921_08940 [Xanthomonas arboricola]|nr:hypothetical protein AE920_19395 [Xanthomonas arboricola]OAH81285.1 hypothetical protein AXA70_04645 [Xanthomonas arboricola pv. juglandis]PPU10845.1 hypothetical protein XacyCFBP2565_18540 [Xanthomonas arboricola pv. corylina]KOB01026.1 hypothetical protein AE921_08940 [Xanthomonas arboricola]KOB07062.1 hypothetical protein AE922_14300 [Xanthomonas arboricola]
MVLECLYVCYVSEFTLNIYSELPKICDFALYARKYVCNILNNVFRCSILLVSYISSKLKAFNTEFVALSVAHSANTIEIYLP